MTRLSFANLHAAALPLLGLLVCGGCADVLGADFDDLRRPGAQQSSGAQQGSGGAGGSSSASGGGGVGGTAGSGGGGVGGSASAELMVLVQDDHRPGDLAVDDTHVYYIIDEIGSDPDDGVWRVPRNGGTPEQIVAQAPPVTHLVLDATHVYFSQAYIIKKVPKAGGSAMELHFGNNLDVIQGLALQAQQLYWTTTNGSAKTGFIRSVGIDGNGFTLLAALGDGGDARDIAVNGTSLFWANALVREVVQMPIGGGTIAPLVTDLHSPSELAINGTHVCFGQEGLVDAVELNGSGHAFLSQSGFVRGAAASTDHCYFGLQAGLLKTPTEMTTALTHAAVANVRDVRVHGNRVFFTADTAGGIVFSIGL